jgi:hypothetical protein
MYETVRRFTSFVRTSDVQLELENARSHHKKVDRVKLNGGEGCKLYPPDMTKPLTQRGCFACPSLTNDCELPDRGSFRQTELKKLDRMFKI